MEVTVINRFADWFSVKRLFCYHLGVTTSMTILKYPRTRHLAGSRLQQGDEDLEIVPIHRLDGRHIVIEEKMDGANSGISFDADGNLYLQSRGHFLQGGPREVQFALFKQWATTHRELLFVALEDRYIAYGEWLYSKHTVFYDALPHYWMEFDIFDRQREVFLDTPSRATMLNRLPIVPVTVLYAGPMSRDIDMAGFIGPSHFKTPRHAESLRAQCQRRELDYPLVCSQTDMTGLMEGLYVKVEEEGIVQERYKFVRADFVYLIIENDEHHMDRPIIPNLLKDGVDLFTEDP